jgi:acetolactate synthase I/III small subunit
MVLVWAVRTRIPPRPAARGLRTRPKTARDAVPGTRMANHDASERPHTIAVLVDNEARRAGARHRPVLRPRLQHREPDGRRGRRGAAALSRITIVTSGTPMVIEQIKAQLDRLVPVHKVSDLTLDGPLGRARTGADQGVGSGDKRVESLRLADIFRARVVDSTTESFVFEMTGNERQARRLHRPHAAARPGRRLAHRRGRHRPRRASRGNAASPPRALCKAFSIFVGYSPRRLWGHSTRVRCAAGWPIPGRRSFSMS